MRFDCRCLLVAALVAGIATTGVAYAQSTTDSSALAGLTEWLNNATASISSVSDDVKMVDSKISGFDSRLAQLTARNDAVDSSLSDIGDKLDTILSRLDMDSKPRTVDLESGNAMGLVISAVVEWIKADVSPRFNDASLVFRHVTLVLNSAFDAVAPYHPTAVGVYSRIDNRPAQESETSLLANTALLHATYHTLNELAPQRMQDWRAIMISHGLNPDDLRGRDLDCNQKQSLTSPVAIGNLAAKCVMEARANDGFNHFGDETPGYPFKDTTGYEPVNTPYKLNDPSRWQPLMVTTGEGIFTIQQFVTPQWADTEPYTGVDTRSVRVPPPANSDFGGNPEGYRAQTDYVIQYTSNLTDADKMLVEFFDNKARGTLILPASTPKDVVGFTQFDFLLTMAQFDAGMMVWQEKQRYDSVRPATSIPYLLGDEPITAWGGPGKGTVEIPASQWMSYASTADHPEYPSATTCFCAAEAEARRLHAGGMDKIPDYVSKTGEIRGGFEGILPAGSSWTEPGITPASDFVLRFDSWSDYEQKCADSRVLGGVHFRAAVDASLDACGIFGQEAYKYWLTLIDGTAPMRGPAVKPAPDPMLDEPFWTEG